LLLKEKRGPEGFYKAGHSAEKNNKSEENSLMDEENHQNCICHYAQMSWLKT
jgi:hypothetical protein